MSEQHSPASGYGGTDPMCDMAHGLIPAPAGDRTLVTVFDSPVAAQLLHFGTHLGYRVVLVEPDPARRPAGAEPAVTKAIVDGATDVVVTDHDRAELGPVLRDTLATSARWIGVMGSPRHPAPHVPALRDLGVPDVDIERVHRPIGLNIGSHSPAEIAVATLAGLIAQRNGRPGGFTF